MRRAVAEALKRLEGGSVLLAPLASSFDQFQDYKDRARAFREAVYALGGEPWTPSTPS
jgi:UDP-N-acetylmuramoylalanine--D-glutamate ligase